VQAQCAAASHQGLSALDAFYKRLAKVPLRTLQAQGPLHASPSQELRHLTQANAKPTVSPQASVPAPGGQTQFCELSFDQTGVRVWLHPVVLPALVLYQNNINNHDNQLMIKISMII
jgi:hypothetical protein